MQPEEITVHAFTVERTTIKTAADELANSREMGRLDNDYDVWLSDMDGETVMILPDGTVINPHSGDEAVDLIQLLEPILAHVPTWKIDQYAARRRSEEE